MGVKETPISDTADTADEDEEGEENGEEEQSEETPPEDSKQEEAPEDKPKRAKAKPEAKKKAEAKPKKKAEAKPEKKAEAKPKKEKKLEEQPEEQPEETPKPAKKAKKDTVDMKQKTMCSICKSEPISNDALLYSHSCKKEALAKRKKHRSLMKSQRNRVTASDLPRVGHFPEATPRQPPPWVGHLLRHRRHLRTERSWPASNKK